MNANAARTRRSRHQRQRREPQPRVRAKRGRIARTQRTRGSDWRGLVDSVVCSDALALLRKLPDGCVGLVWIDPPYGNNNGVDDLASARARDKVAGGRQSGAIVPIANDDRESWAMLMPQVLKEINRVLKPDGCCCCCCCCGGGPSPVFAQITFWLDQYHDFFQAVVWDKSARGNGLGWRYRRNYEFVMVSHKRGGKLRWNKDRKARPNVLNYRPTDNALHPTQKPELLVEEFILNHTYAGDLVLDCFMGSGTTLVAAQKLGRHYIGCDISADYVALAQKRLAKPYDVPLFDVDAA